MAQKIELHTHWIDKLAILNGFISGLALLPQLFQAVFSKNLNGLSPLSFGIIFFNSLIWCLYAFHRRLLSLFLASVLTLTSAGILWIVLLVK